MKLDKSQLLMLLLILGINLPMLGQKKITSRTIAYDGMIDKYPIKAYMEYKENGNWVYGKYIYAKYPTNEPITLVGDMPVKTFSFSEEVYDVKSRERKTTGIFQAGDFTTHKVLEGKWTNKTNNKVTNFQFNAVEKNADAVFYYKANVGKCEEESYNEYYVAFNSVKLYDEHKQFIQEITLPDSYSYKKSGVEVSMGDYNFDGYLDIIVSHYYPFVSKGDYGEYYLIYNPTTKKFKYDKNFNTDYSSLMTLNPLNQTLSTFTADGNGNETETTYSVQDNKPYKIKYWESTEDSDKVLEVKYKVVNGKSVEISRTYK